MQKLFSLLVILTIAGCFGGSGKKLEPSVQKTIPKKEDGTIAIAKPPSKPLPPDPCIINDKIQRDPPLYIDGKNVVVTQILKPCVTRDGRRGFDKESPWMAMGFPCTGGGGKISLIGNYYAPKMVSFIISTDCPMDPNSMDTVSLIGQSDLGMTEEMKLLSFNSFVVQFWEVPGLVDADTGFTIDLSSPAGREGQWRRLRKKEPMRLWLYGRENSWTSRESFYKVEAEMTMTADRSFKLSVVDAKALDAEELAEVKGRCESLRPRRNCLQVF